MSCLPPLSVLVYSKNIKDQDIWNGKHYLTLATLKLERLPDPVKRQLPALCEGHFVDRAENVLAFGLPGRGKTHLLCAVGHELINRGYRVLFTPTYQLV